uniref:VWFA domain-containing protein n=1 Tax=Rhabditophanes sp. KR3021 TaxID=114890 RepID=A0AC35TKI2_9BILA
MKTTISLLFLAAIYAFPFESKKQSNGVERMCSDNIAGLYLDIVLVFDSSDGVGSSVAFNDEKGLVLPLLKTTIQISQQIPQATRIAYMTAGTDATIINDLVDFGSVKEAYAGLMKLKYNPKAGYTLNIGRALFKADYLLNSQKRDPTRNQNYKKVIILFTSETDVDCPDNMLASSEVCRTAAGIKNGGTEIMTIRLNFQESGPLSPTGISSPCASFDNDGKVHENIRKSLLRLNCYCISPFVKYIRATDACFASADCVYFEESATTYNSARETAAESNALLVTIRTKEKQSYISKFTRIPMQMHIGLNQLRNASDWQWESGPDASQGYTNFAPGVITKSNSCAYMDTRSEWRNEDCDGNNLPYIFETEACSTSNFCF